MPEGSQFLVGEKKLRSRTLGFSSPVEGISLEAGKPGFREGAKRSDHTLEPLTSDPLFFARRPDDKPDAHVKEMAADLVGGGLEIVFAFVEPARRGFKGAMARKRGLKGETAKNFLGGHVDFYGGSLPPILAHAQAGKAKCFLLTSAEGNAALPGAQGLAALNIADQETVLWWGLIAPSNTPPALVEQIEKAFHTLLISYFIVISRPERNE